MERQVPTKDEVMAYLLEDSNWGRWGPDDQVGAVNLITPEKRVAAARLVRSGRAVSLSREFPKTPALNNPWPASHYIRWKPDPNHGEVQDYLGIFYHGPACTHLDALCHEWGPKGIWNGRDPHEIVTYEGVNFGSVHHWKEQIMTRGVLLDVPKHRGEPFVTIDQPVHGWELEDIAKEEGISLEAGDALAIYCGREAYDRANDRPWGSGLGSNKDPRPGPHASCLKFLRQSDCAVLLWDMKECSPNEYKLPWTVGGATFAYGVAFVDNALLEPLAVACAEEARYEFMLTVSPLRVVGGTGSPVNPIAFF